MLTAPEETHFFSSAHPYLVVMDALSKSDLGNYTFDVLTIIEGKTSVRNAGKGYHCVLLVRY